MRYLQTLIERDLTKKMVFVGGPRQCGKTTLARAILSGSKGRYFNWDSVDDRLAMLRGQWANQDRLLVFDELHKYPKWKSWIKGIFDTQKELHRFLVTGSARLDVYRRGGDSLMGRYHYWRLHPFTLSERPPKLSAKEALDRLLRVGGFPEPFLDNDEREARRWRRERMDRVIRDDLRDLEPIREIQGISLLVELLRTRVGGPVVASNLAEDLQVSPKTVQHWLELLEKMYVIFLVRPLTANIARAIRKPPKVYFYDNADVADDEGARFENLVATSLLKEIQFREDYEGFKFELRYVRDKEGREVDFAILKDGHLEELVEAKVADESVSKSLSYYSEKLNPPRARQIMARLKAPYSVGKLDVLGAIDALSHGSWQDL